MTPNDASAPTAEKRTFTAAPSLLMHVINSQAGSCGKAVLELIMNSVDAGATRITIDVERGRMRIVDDGCGFATREAILSTFEVFGFDHTGLKREFGRFGLGRGQLWKFCRTRFLTHSFCMDVDIPTKGLDYDLSENMPHVDGLTIEATFYTPLSATDEATLLRDICEMAKFAVIPVILNGKQISTHPDKAKWTLVTEDAYLKLSESGGLKVMNQGLLVCELSRYTVGIGGIICTRPGVNMPLNMARNEVERDSPLWKKLAKLCKETADSQLKKPGRVRLAEDDRLYLVSQMIDPCLTIDNLFQPVFTLADGRHVNFEKLYDAFCMLPMSGRAITVAGTGSRIGERLQRERSAVVLTMATLARFEVTTVTELFERLDAMVGVAEPGTELPVGTRWDASNLLRLIDCMRRAIVEDIKTLPCYKAIEAATVPDSDLSPDMRSFLRAVRAVNDIVAGRVRRYTQAYGSLARKVVAGDSDGAEAYTDGSTYIAIVRTTLHGAMKEGHAGMLRMAHLLVHEYLHDDSDLGSHQHDLEFYEAFHNIVLDHGTDITQVALSAYLEFSQSVERRSVKVARQMDKLEQVVKAEGVVGRSQSSEAAVA